MVWGIGGRREGLSVAAPDNPQESFNWSFFLQLTGTRSFMDHAHDERLFLNHLRKPLGVLSSTLGSSGYGHNTVRTPGPSLQLHGSLSIWPIMTLFSFVRRCLVGGRPKIYTRPSF